jgi:UDP-N-acetylmuramate dehydrogenase
MMALRPSGAEPLICRLPPVRGRLRQNVALAPMTWFRVGGQAEVMFRPADADDLAAFLAACPGDVPVTVIGVGSNLLVRDGGVPGVVIRLGAAFAQVDVTGEDLRAGAAALDGTVARTAAAAGLAGLEFLIGIPGTVGGAVRMNAGAYGHEVKDCLITAEVVFRDGTRQMLAAADLGLAYRHSTLAADAIVLSARFHGWREDPGAIDRHMATIRAARDMTQPVRSRTGGSTFANPPGAKAWELIDRAGCRGLRIGGAQVSEQHCNFLINTGTATARDLERLGEEVRRRVFLETGVTLEWEIRRIGVPASGPAAEGAT